MDTFDPTPDGLKAYTLAETVDAARHLLEAFDTFDNAMWGCRTPLDFRQTLMQMRELRASVAVEVDKLKKVRNIIEEDRPLPTVHLDPDDPWTDPRRRNQTPDNVLQLRAMAKELDRDHPDHATTTFRELIGTQAVPMLVRIQRAKRALAEKEQKVASDAASEAKKAALSDRRLASRAAHQSEATGAADRRPPAAERDRREPVIPSSSASFRR